MNNNQIVNPEIPAISVIIPIHNEEKNIQKCLLSILEQNYESHIEIICIDGMSTDDTRNKIVELMKKNSCIKLIKAKSYVTSVLLNIGIRNAKYEYIARVDAHCTIHKDYLKNCAKILLEYKASNVGGRWQFTSNSYTGRAISMAMDTTFGTGPARWRRSKQIEEVDTVPFGFWKKEYLEKIDGFDESLLRNQDYELNYRIRKNGGRIIYSPNIIINYSTFPLKK